MVKTTKARTCACESPFGSVPTFFCPTLLNGLAPALNHVIQPLSLYFQTRWQDCVLKQSCSWVPQEIKGIFNHSVNSTCLSNPSRLVIVEMTMTNPSESVPFRPREVDAMPERKWTTECHAMLNYKKQIDKHSGQIPNGRHFFIPTTPSNSFVRNRRATGRGKLSKLYLGAVLGNIIRETNYMVNLVLRWYIVLFVFVPLLPRMGKMALAMNVCTFIE